MLISTSETPDQHGKRAALHISIYLHRTAAIWSLHMGYMNTDKLKLKCTEASNLMQFTSLHRLSLGNNFASKYFYHEQLSTQIHMNDTI